MDDECIKLAKENNCTITPTTWVLANVTKSDAFKSLMENPKELNTTHNSTILKAKNAGVPILMGSDSIFLGMHGKNYIELRYLMKTGMSNLEVWYAGTGAGAAAMDATDVGAIRKGNIADLLFFNSDVIEEPGQIDEKNMIEVMKSGKGYKNYFTTLEQISFESTLESRIKK